MPNNEQSIAIRTHEFCYLHTAKAAIDNVDLDKGELDNGKTFIDTVPEFVQKLETYMTHLKDLSVSNGELGGSIGV